VTALSRVQLFRGGGSPLRPPWAVAEQRFVDVCTRCGECLRQCPQAILVSGRGGFPEVDFSAGECTFCAACLEHCRSGALRRTSSGRPWSAVAEIQSSCLANIGVECRICAEHCEARAISIELQPGGVGRPVVNRMACSGCGACRAVCPVAAVTVTAATTTPDAARLVNVS
jgi:ferredoxin-type protein NapF